MEHHYPLFFELILKNKPFKAGDIFTFRESNVQNF